MNDEGVCGCHRPTHFQMGVNREWWARRTRTIGWRGVNGSNDRVGLDREGMTRVGCVPSSTRLEMTQTWDVQLTVRGLSCAD